MGHTDVVPVNADGWSRDPFSGEIDRRLGVGPRRGRHAQPHRVAGGGVPPARRVGLHSPRARSSTSRSPTRRRSAPGARKWLVEHERDAVYADYVLTESGGFQMPTPEGSRLPVMVAEKGTYWSKLRVRGTPGHGSQPFRTDNALVTAAEVVRRIARVPARRRRSTRSGAGSSRGWTTRPRSATRSSTRRAPRRARRAAARDGAARARVHAHDDRAERRARRHEDQRHPRRGRARGRHPHAARARRATTSRAMLAEALGDLADQRRDRVERRPVHRVADRHAVVGRAVAACQRPARRGLGARAVPHGRRHRQPVLPPRRLRRLRLRAVQPSGSRSRTTPRCSTATTSASTSSRSVSRSSSGRPSPRDLLDAEQDRVVEGRASRPRATCAGDATQRPSQRAGRRPAT